MLTTEEIRALCKIAEIGFYDGKFYAQMAGRACDYAMFESPNAAHNELWHLYCEHGFEPLMTLDTNGNVGIGATPIEWNKDQN